MMLQDECPTYVDGHDQKSVILNAALAAKWWEPAKVMNELHVVTRSYT